jgi:hypothetical protein
MIAQPAVLIMLAVAAALIFAIHRWRGSSNGPAPLSGHGESGGGGVSYVDTGDCSDGSGAGDCGGGDGGGGD